MAKVLSAKIKDSNSRGSGCLEYNNRINITDFKQLAQLFSDLELHGAKIEKAFKEYQKLKEKWPFG